MNKRIEEIKEFLILMNKKFPKMKFRCGYGASDHTYIVEVKPLKEFSNNEEYAKAELDFTESFESVYKDYDLIFVSDEDLCRVDEALFMVGYDDDPQYIPNKLKFDFDFDEWMRPDNNSYYTLAS